MVTWGGTRHANTHTHSSQHRSFTSAPHGPCPVFERRFRSLQIASQDRVVKLTHTIKLATLTAPYMLTMKRGEEATTKAIIVTSCGPNRPKQIVLPYSAIPSTYRPAVFHRVHLWTRGVAPGCCSSAVGSVVGWHVVGEHSAEPRRVVAASDKREAAARAAARARGTRGPVGALSTGLRTGL